MIVKSHQVKRAVNRVESQLFLGAKSAFFRFPERRLCRSHDLAEDSFRPLGPARAEAEGEDIRCPVILQELSVKAPDEGVVDDGQAQRAAGAVVVQDGEQDPAQRSPPRLDVVFKPG
jgi:hypothetical protein